MKKWIGLVVIGFLCLVPALGQAQVDKMIDRFLPRGEQRGEGRIGPRDLSIDQFEFSPDPIREGQRVIFRATVSNQARHSGRVTLILKDKDEVISELRDVVLRPGENRIEFPESNYRFSRSDTCFTVEADIEHNRRPIDTAKEFCARKTYSGWTLSDKGVGPVFVEELDMSPDPATSSQDVRFRVKLRNDGRPVRGSVRIQDKDQVVAQVENVMIPRGVAEFQLPFARYSFQRDRCFTVVADVERTPYLIDAEKEFCARRTYSGWSLGDKGVGPVFVEDLDMTPDPATPGQDVRFRVRLRNDGRPVRASIRIQDKDQVVAQVENAMLPRGNAEFQFPYTRYTFQRFDHCFSVILDVERTPYRIDAVREFCAKPMGWSLRP